MSIETAVPTFTLPDTISWGGKNGKQLLAAPVVIGKVRRPYLSASTADAVRGCAARMVFDKILPRVDDPFGPAELGTEAHAIFESLFNLPPEERTMSTVSRLMAELDQSDHGPKEERGRWLASVNQLVSGIFLVEDPTKIDVVANELKFETIINDVPVLGYIDRLGTKNGHLTISDYKGLALDTPIPTPTGWTTMGELAVGEFVIGGDGSPVLVTHKSQVHDRDCFEISFSDGSSVVSDDVHVWVVGKSVHGIPKEMSMPVLYEQFTSTRNMSQPTSFVIRNGSPMEGSRVDLPIDPWVLGAWLGDGSSKTGDLTIGHADLDDMLTIIKERWGESTPANWSVDSKSHAANVALKKPLPDHCGRGHNTWRDKTKSNGSVTRRCAKCNSSNQHEPVWNKPLRALLDESGLLLNKYVPSVYLRASVEQRLDLLRGLMDTDGHWHPVRKQAVFVNSNLNIADAVAEIASSLGVNTTRHTVVSKIGNKDSYRVSFAPVGFNPFLLPRKADLCTKDMSEFRTMKIALSLHRRITDIKPVPRVPTQCITVEAQDSLFLCGRTMIPTHNSGKVANIRYGDKHGDQIRIYFAAINAIEAIAQKATRGELLYTSFNTVREADLSEDAVKITLRDFKTSWQKLGDMLEKGEFPTKPSKLCGWCPAKDVCPASSTREDATSTAKPAPPKMYEDDDPNDFIQPLNNSKAKTAPAPVQKPGGGAREIEKPQQKGATQKRSAKERSNMSEENKPWEEYDGDGLNLNSYAATAAFGLTSMAYDILSKAQQRTNGDAVRALAQTFVKIINDANALLGGEESLSFQAGRHTRLRGALHTAVETAPPPFGGDDEAWESWVTVCTRRVAGIFGVALVLWENPSVATPWSALIRVPKGK